jgi:uncharacterized protein
MGEPHDLDRRACEELLRRNDVGRVAVCAPDGPHVVPVNYVVTEGAVVIRTSPYTILGTHGRDHMVALEVDRLDHETREGWSVLVRGKASMVADPDDIQRIRADGDPGPWADGSRRLYIRLPWQELTGRRVGHPPDLEG